MGLNRKCDEELEIFLLIKSTWKSFAKDTVNKNMLLAKKKRNSLFLGFVITPLGSQAIVLFR